MATTTELSPGRPALVDEGGASRARRPDLDDAWTAIAIAGPALLALMARLPTTDLAYHLRVGRTIRVEHAIPRSDLMAFGSGGGGWLDQQWGAQVLLSFAYDIGGFATLVLLRGLCAAALAYIVFATCRARGASARTASGLTIAMYVVAMPYLALRPQLFGAMLFASCLLVLAVRRDRPGLVWVIPVVTVPWVNVHGSFALAVAVMGFAVAEDLLERRATTRSTMAAFAATVAATFVNPFGGGAWVYVAAIGGNSVIRNAVEEWQPPTVETAAGATFLIALIGAAGLLARRGRALRSLDLVWLGGLTVLALHAQRNVLWWALAAVPLAATMLPAGPTVERRASRIATVVVAVLCLALIVALPWVGRQGPLVSGVPPEALVAEADRRLDADARLLVYQPWASWMELEVPSASVFVDSRIEIFPEAVWRDYREAISGGSDVGEVLAAWRIDAVLFPSDHEPLRVALTNLDGWSLASEHGGGLLFVRGAVE